LGIGGLDNGYGALVMMGPWLMGMGYYYGAMALL